MSSDLEAWLKKVHAAKSRADVFRVVEEFRPLTWSDEQRAVMAKTYIRAVENLAAGSESTAGAAAPSVEAGADGPVWYEKM